MVRQIPKWVWPVGVFLVIALVILGPALMPGYIFSYDMIFVPHPHADWSGWLSGAVPGTGLVVASILSIISHIIPMDWVQKIVLIGIIAGSGLAMYFAVPVKSNLARYWAGFFYIVNPFFYTRLMAGHWLFLIGYALTPLVVVLALRLFAQPSARRALELAGLWSLVALCSPHHVVIIGVLLLVLAFVYVRTWKTAGYLALSAGITAIISSFWLIPLFFGHTYVGGFNLDQYYAFATVPDSRYGLPMAMISLQGFWHSVWLSIQSWAFWPIVWFVVTLPVWAGMAALFQLKRPDRRLYIALLITGLVCMFLAAGPAQYIYGLNVWIFTHIPGLNGLREPQKYLALLALAFAYFGALGIATLQKLWPRVAIPVVGVSIVAAAIMCWPLWWGAHGQLVARPYTPAWGQFETYLAEHKDNSRILAMPWEPYLVKTFAKDLIANPAQAYYGPRVLQNNELTLPGANSNGVGGNSDIAQIVSSSDIGVWKKAIEKQNIGYLIVIKGQDRFDPSFLVANNLAKRLYSDGELGVYNLIRKP